MGENPELIAMAREVCAKTYTKAAGRICSHTEHIEAKYRQGLLDGEMEMRAAIAAIIETQERDAALAEDHVLTRPDDDHQLGQTEAAQSIAAAIRSGQQFRKDV